MERPGEVPHEPIELISTSSNVPPIVVARNRKINHEVHEEHEVRCDEDGAEKLAKVIDPIITQSGLGEINGFEHGSGRIDVLIFGKATDSDVDQIYELLAPTFRAFKCPAGSHIIRVYNERNEEVESDVVPENAT